MTKTEMLQISFNDSYKMLKEIIKVCPDDLWKADNHGLPVWNHVIHTLMGISFWLREDYKVEFDFGLPLPEKMREKLYNDEWFCEKDGFMTKAEVNDCIEVLDSKLEGFWKFLDDEKLDEKTFEQYDFSFLSVVLGQIRHIMCHVGMCNNTLIENGYDEAGWLAFGENDFNE